MSDGWDLYAVVRSCSAATATAAATPSVDDPHMEEEQPLTNLSFQNHTPISYHEDDQNISSNYCGLEEVYYHNELQYVQPLEQAFSNIDTDHDFQGFENYQHEVQYQSQQMLTNNPLAPTLTNSQSTTARPRRRKNQHMKMVYQMTQEELSADSWAWRKYGQKPIKGSPYPRNYYRCSTLKGCSARKQVERSPTDSTIFIVSYTGEHAHPRPTHRSSLAGSTRSKFSAAAALSNMIMTNTSGGDSSSPSTPTFVPSKPHSCTSSSPRSSSSSPLIEGDSHDGRYDYSNQSVDDIEMMEVDDEEEDEEDILIPNTAMNEEMLKGFQQVHPGTPGFF